jgi:hypothetical protein
MWIGREIRVLGICNRWSEMKMGLDVSMDLAV